VLRKLWSESRVTHHGRFYNFDDVTIEPRPARGSLDVWIGGRTDVALKRVARYGDGWFPSFIRPDEFRTGLEKLATYATEYGRTVDGREAGVVLLTYAHEDRARAAQVAQLVTANFPQTDGGASDRFAIGSPEACVAKIQAYVDAGCTKYVLFPLAPPDELIGQIELYGRQIIPRFSS
jgi:alkanesulfonate monooxygenase SsuD/methylene tetrahydromethanopterin reductase-like flavin-dependent oxidoreductase (luciferase family)